MRVLHLNRGGESERYGTGTGASKHATSHVARRTCRHGFGEGGRQGSLYFVHLVLVLVACSCSSQDIFYFQSLSLD